MYDLCCCVLAVISLPKNHLSVFGSTATRATASAPAPAVATTGESVVPETVHRLDLSYLHRCGVGDIADTIRGTLKQQQQQQQQQQQKQQQIPSTQRNQSSKQPPKGGTSDDESANLNETPTTKSSEVAHPAAAAAAVDIDLTASLIGKNISDLLSSFQRSEAQRDDSLQAMSVMVRLTARRNQLSPKEATEVLEFLLRNGPTNVTTLTTTTMMDEREKDETKEAVAPATDYKDGDPLPEISAVEDSEQGETTNNNRTAVDSAAGGNANEDGTTPDGSTKPSENDDDLNISVAQNDAGDVGDEAEPLAEIEAEEIKPIAKTGLRPAFVSIQSLDLGWNNLGGGVPISNGRISGDVQTMNGAIRRLLADSKLCPPTIRLNVCGLGPPACREMAKGILERYQTQTNQDNGEEQARPLLSPPSFLSLDLARNQGIGDVGVAALAAAIRTVATGDGSHNRSTEKKKRKRRRRKSSKQQPAPEGNTNELEEEKAEQENADETEDQNNDQTTPAEPSRKTRTIFERLDLSGCDIGDAGAEALAIALTNNPLCVKHLDLSSNRITDRGAEALAGALGSKKDLERIGVAGESACHIGTLDLSHNKDLGDTGAKELAKAFQRDGISRLLLRSCNVRADGAAFFGTALRSIGSRSTPRVSSRTEDHVPQRRLIDLSGNPLGILSKKKKSGSKYSATALRSKAKDTTKAYMNIIGKSLQKGLNSISGEGGGPDTLESDDEEEDRMGGEFEEEDAPNKKCGAMFLADAFIRDGVDRTERSDAGSDRGGASVAVELGLRQCSFDTKAAEALAAVLQESNDRYPGMELSMDMAMNNVLEDSIVAALHREDDHDDQLADMAEVYLDALAVMREARQRAVRAARLAAERAKLQAERDSAWGAVPPTGSGYDIGRSGGWSDRDEEEDDWYDSIEEDHYNPSEEEYSDDRDW